MEWKERIRDPKVECMSRDEMTALQSERLVKLVERVYKNVTFYHEKMKALGVEPGDIKGVEDIDKLPFTTKEDLRENYPFGLFGSSEISGSESTGNFRNDGKTDTCILHTE